MRARPYIGAVDVGVSTLFTRYRDELFVLNVEHLGYDSSYRQKLVPDVSVVLTFRTGIFGTVYRLLALTKHNLRVLDVIISVVRRFLPQ